MTHINDISVNDDPNNMFGGEKNSGIGRFNSDWIIAELTSDHWNSVQHKRRAYPFYGQGFSGLIVWHECPLKGAFLHTKTALQRYVICRAVSCALLLPERSARPLPVGYGIQFP